MGFLNFLTGFTPGGAVGEASAKVATTLFDGLTGLINEFHLSPEQELQAKIAIEQQRLEFYKAQTQDVSSARAMQMMTKSLWPGILSTTVMVGYFTALYELFTAGSMDLTTNGGAVLLMLIQTLNVAVGMVLQFWLGSSSQSQQKDIMLFNSSPSTPKVNS